MKGMAIRLAVLTLTFMLCISARAFLETGRLNPSRTLASTDGSSARELPGQTKKNEIEDEEYAVYSAILNNNQGADAVESGEKADRLLVILNKPEAWVGLADESEEKFYEDFKTSSPELLSETIDDLRAKNKESYLLTRRFDTRRRYVIVSEDEIESFFKLGINDGWERFYKKYPDSSGYATFSRVGFNHDKTQALVYAANSCGGLCGGGSYYLLVKRRDAWIIKGPVGATWVS